MKLVDPTLDQLDAVPDMYEAKPVKGFPDYLITRCGRIFRITFKNKQVTRTYNPPREIARPVKNGYPTANLHKAGKLHTKWVHQLMLETFVGPRPIGFVAAHNNGIRHDVRIENLAWKTPRQNYDDMFSHGTNPAGMRNPHRRLTDNDVLEMRRLKASGWTTSALQRRFSMSRTAVQKICSGKMWKHLLRAHGVEVEFTK